MNFQDKIKNIAETAEKAATEAVQRAGDLAHEKRERVAAGLDKVAAKVDERTDGKYADKVARAKEQINRGVDKLADQRAGGAADPAAGEPTADHRSATETDRSTGTLIELPDPPAETSSAAAASTRTSAVQNSAMSTAATPNVATPATPDAPTPSMPEVPTPATPEPVTGVPESVPMDAAVFPHAPANDLLDTTYDSPGDEPLAHDAEPITDLHSEHGAEQHGWDHPDAEPHDAVRHDGEHHDGKHHDG